MRRSLTTFAAAALAVLFCAACDEKDKTPPLKNLAGSAQIETVAAPPPGPGERLLLVNVLSEAGEPVNDANGVADCKNLGKFGFYALSAGIYYANLPQGCFGVGTAAFDKLSEKRERQIKPISAKGEALNFILIKKQSDKQER